ncbi:MAG: CRISPR-associated CARF protein Csx1 [Candidatus Hadarchaeales archaeon]
MRSILISSWGKPWRTGGEFSWEKVEYRLKEISKTSRSSLPVLVEHTKPERIVIVVLDTVAEKVCSDYQKLCKMVEKRYLDFIQKELEISEEVKVIVAPGVGNFKLKFKGEMADFYHYVFFELSKELAELKENGEVHLDITHGLNFAPVFLRLALEEILSILAYTKNIKFVLYNAEPFTSEAKEKLSLTIHHIEQKVYPKLGACRIGELGEAHLLRVRKEHKGDVEFCKEISKISKISNRKELSMFLCGMVNGLPLCLYTFCPDPRELEEKLSQAIETWRKNIELKPGEVERKVSLTQDFTECMKAWLLVRSINIQKKEIVTLEELQKLSELLFFKHEKPKNMLISHELSEIKEKADKEKCSEWTPLKSLFSDKKISPFFEPRNFFAHAGFEYNTTEVRYSERGLEFRYKEDCRKEIMKVY